MGGTQKELLNFLKELKFHFIIDDGCLGEIEIVRF